jgi:hypothetical protein
MILQLLQPGILNYRAFWSQMQDIKLVGEEQIETVACHLLCGSDKKKDDIEVWVRQTDLAVSRIRTRMEISKDEADRCMERTMEVFKGPLFSEMMDKAKKAGAFDFISERASSGILENIIEKMKDGSMFEDAKKYVEDGMPGLPENLKNNERLMAFMSPGAESQRHWTEYNYKEITFDEPISDSNFEIGRSQ